MGDVKGPSRRERYAALTRQAVLDAARRLFVEQGFAATSVADIAREAEASKGAVYHHFTDKHEIFADVFRSTQTAVLQTAAGSIGTPATSWEGFEKGAQAFLYSYGADEQARTLLKEAIGVLGWDSVGTIDGEFGLSFIRHNLENLVRAGEIVSVDVETAANLLLGLYCYAVLFIAAADDPQTALPEVENVLTQLLRGLATH